MHRRLLVVVTAAALMACAPASDSGFVQSAVVSAQEGRTAAGTLQQLLEGRDKLLAPYRSAAVDDTLSTATKALDDLESEPPPGPEARQAFDQLHPRLQELVATAREARDALDAGAQERVAAAERQVAALREQLDAFVTSRP